MAISISIQLNEKLYLRDPQETKLGKRIIQHGILLLDEIGLEAFTFRKLAERIGSTEASIYRYFENKHLLLVYLLSWYWEWMRYQIEYNINNIEDPREKLRIAIATMVNSSKPNASIEFVDEDILHRLVVAEGDKGYHTKEVDTENKAGIYLTLKRLNSVVADIISEIDPEYPYPRALASTLQQMSKEQVYFALHLPRMTDVTVAGEDYSEVEKLMLDFAFGLLGKK